MRRGRYPRDASKQGGQDRVRTLSAAHDGHRSGALRHTPVSRLYILANDEPTVSRLYILANNDEPTANARRQGGCSRQSRPRVCPSATSANDVSIGGPNDTLTGNGGNDMFVFNGKSGTNTITDFNVSQDVIAFDDTRFHSVDLSVFAGRPARTGWLHSIWR